MEYQQNASKISFLVAFRNQDQRMIKDVFVAYDQPDKMPINQGKTNTKSTQSTF